MYLKGRIIAIEGTDGVGKQTQCELFKKYIEENHNPCVVYSFPRYGTETGKKIKEALCDPNIDMLTKINLFADDRLAARNEILEDIHADKTVILDRYITSMMVYSAAELKIDTFLSKFIDINQLISDVQYFIYEKEIIENRMPVCDMQIILTLPIDLSQKMMADRIDKDLNENNKALQLECLNQYKNISRLRTLGMSRYTTELDCSKNVEVLPEQTIAIISANIIKKVKTIEEIHNEIKNIIDAYIW